MRKGHYTLIDTLNLYTDYFTEADYEDCVGEKPTTTEFIEWKNDQAELEIEDFWENLKNLKLDCEGFIIEGTLGLWYGKREIEQTFEKTLYDAVSRCVGDSDYMEVRKVNNHLEVIGHHHDGTNVFEIYGLTEKGYDVLYDREHVSTKRKVNIATLPEYLW